MSSPILTNVNQLISRADGYENAGTIDSTTNMANDKVYVFAGKSDSVVNPSKLSSYLVIYTNWHLQ